MQIKTIGRCDLHTCYNANIKKANAHQDTEQLEPSAIVRRNVKRHNHLRRLAVAKELNLDLSHDPVIPLLEIELKVLKNICPQKGLYTDIHRSLSHNTSTSENSLITKETQRKPQGRITLYLLGWLSSKRQKKVSAGEEGGGEKTPVRCW